MPKTPAYRKRNGYTQALVTLTDAATKRRKDYWLGDHGTPESREAYHRVIAEWEANGRRWPDPATCAPLPSDADDVQVKRIIRDYWRWASSYYHETRAGAVKSALRLLRSLYGETPASQFGPKSLRLLREAMIRGDAQADPPRPPWSRKYINSQIQCIRHMFKWAVARELIPSTTHQALCAMEPLRRGRSEARENPRVGPVPQYLLEATLPHLNRHVRAVVELQLLTGARPGELLGLRPVDITMDEATGVWTYRPEEHKNAYREKARVIFMGPKAQVILRSFLSNRPTTAYIFSPAQSEAERRTTVHQARATPLSCGNRPGTNRRAVPARQPGDRYSTPAYYKSIRYACDRAFPPTGHLARHAEETTQRWMDRLKAKGLLEDLAAWRKSHRWHPHQLRHNAATNLRREFGLEAAQLALGHASAQITDAVYAERDEARVIEIMRKIG